MRRPFLRHLIAALILSLVLQAAQPAPASAGTIHHYEYVFIAGVIYVYDMDNGFKLLKTVQVPTGAGMRGGVASAATGMLYLAYGSDGNSGGFQLAYDLATDKVAWTMSYSHGIDSQSVTPDGKKIYMPGGEVASSGTWYVEDPVNGSDLATISTGGTGPHNTIVSPGGTRVYMGDRDFNNTGTNDFNIADTATNQIVAKISPLMSGARPFTINSAETLTFNTVTGFMGFQVGDVATGKVIYTVTVDGSNIPGFTTQTPATIPSHGISLSPDGKEIYLIDQPNSYVHVFDVTGLPGSAPVQVADIKLVNPISGNEAGCAYDCLKDGWIHHSRDGRFVFVGDSGDVIDTITRKTIATLPHMADSRQQIEIDFQDTTPIWAATSRSGVGYANPLPTTFTARISAPALGSTVSGNVTVATSVFDTATVTSVDLFKDGVLLASRTSSPYSFTWDTTGDANGTHELLITAHDALGNDTSFLASFTVSNTVTANPPAISTASLPGATQNAAYSDTLAATGGTTPYTWSISSGTLPAGLALASATGAITGTPTATGTSTFTVKVTDAHSLTATKSLSIAVSATLLPPAISTTSLPGATQNAAYSDTLTASGGTTPYTWSISSGTLPAGLALASATGAITGTPTGTGTSTFTVKVTDAHSLTATKSLSIAVSATLLPPAISTASLPGATQNAAYSDTLTASGGTTPYAWSISSGTLPAGLALASATGAITGTPTATGTSTFTVKVTDAHSLTATKSLSIAVGVSTSVKSITNPAGSSQSAMIGAAFASTLKATVKDPSGNPLAGATVTFTAPPQTGPSGTFAGGVNTATTNASGIATSPAFTANNVPGPYEVTASVTGAAASATFSLTNVDFTIDVAGPSVVQMTAGTPSSVALGLVTKPDGAKLPADVNLSCVAQLPQGSTTCALTPAKISAGSPSGSVSMLTINATAQLPPAPRRPGPSNPRLPWALAAALAGLAAIYIASRQQMVPARGRMAYLTLALLVVCSTGLAGCVGLTSADHGSSNVTVTATSQGVSKTATISVSLK